MNFTPTFGWYYISANRKAPAWTGVPYLYNFLTRREETPGPFGAHCALEEVLPGDLVQLGTETGRFYHTPVITAITPRILVAAHTDDALDRPLDSYRFARARFIRIEGVRY